MILTLRTDSDEAQLGLYAGTEPKGEHRWQAGRQLSQELLPAIEELLKKAGLNWQGLTGLVIYEGPGSFTGLRIGITVANTLAYSLQIPIVGARGEDWTQQGLAALSAGNDQKLVKPHYGAEPNITRPQPPAGR